MVANQTQQEAEFYISKTLIALVVLCLISAIAVVVVKHKNRVAFVELQRTQAQNDQLQIEWGRLKLEYATWAAAHQLADEANDNFNMFAPAPEDIVTIEINNQTGTANKLEVLP